MASLSAEDEGKVLVDSEGKTIGIVTSVEENTAYVDPDAGITDAVLSALGRGTSDEGAIVVEGDLVETVTDAELRLGSTV
ncbi:hypothetical protein [Natronorarus salvus]|uniref:hypothetical protein n=1 Tax=Natronorarus salvus TaxID=3117733 RepID=UPI002F2612FA